MTRKEIIQSWKSEDENPASKRKRGKQGQRQEKIPPNPVGQIELSDEDLKNVAGGSSPQCSDPGFNRI